MSERVLLPIVPTGVESDNLCMNCNGACCHAGTVVELSEYEKTFLEGGGAQLECTWTDEEVRRLADLKAIAKRYGAIFVALGGTNNPQYIFKQDCPFLVRDGSKAAMCAVYDNPERPNICSTFPTGSVRCLEFRELRFTN